ncbi:Coenzyme F420 hydrogenase/dehydrogenase, beta subunit C-terminal domain [Plantactinospora soyae]|uniref:Coenzyme F420 hydrogenase subunit beta n=1 Tax=Plantactinospora soyae TaxID=1544732 RepID=A0A927M382_9ACTN|nr:Coenzyme F420 hydrogenase/dehydrogenase, beta subunit C-terminal domain [Plantactinospora soyae]MBE1484718.1 coenzyme F420 hydrogenase subunit beta [Plantactinospora soyae]
MVRPRTVHDVASGKLCTGCGVCAYLAPDEVRMVDVLDHGRRPLPITPLRAATRAGDSGAAAGGGAAAALACCPGARLAHESARPEPGEIAELRGAWGPVRAIWEGYAADPEIRYAGSSGGVATALAGYCLTGGGMAGVLHIGARADVPYLNETRLSRTPAELLANAGSRYAPASPCDRLDLIETAGAPCVFVGKPCDVAAVRMARQVRPELDRRLGLTIAIFCAGTPTTRGTLEMLTRLGVPDPARLESVHYRGAGWPGQARARLTDDPPGRQRELSYAESWGDILQKHRQWRCYLCADHTGEFADVAVGDPWYRPTGDDPGQSLVLARTERGVRLVEAAIAAGVLVLTPVAAGILPASQPNLLRARGAVWGRLTTLRLAGLMAPRLRHLPMAGIWWRHLSIGEKLRSTIGTLRRIGRKRLREPAALDPYRPPAQVRSGTAAEPAGRPPE